nr:Chain P, CYS-PRO-LYS-ARG-PHE-M70-ALA-LEU-PHE-CYS [synthetic construct]
CPKRFAALFC